MKLGFPHLMFALIAGLSCASALHAAEGAAATSPREIKVVIISMFGPEAEPWIAPLALNQEVAIRGLSKDYPDLKCNADDICLLTTGMGHSNAAASVMALTLAPQLDLRKTWFLVAGIAGIDPAQGSIGSAAWARYLVDFGIAHELDARDMPKGWKSGYFGILTKGPGIKPAFDYRTEVFQLDEALLQKAVALSANAKLEDSPGAAKYRKQYPDAPANQPPRVVQCDTLAGDTWWHGHHLGQQARDWMQLLTDGKGRYCTTQQEDNATMEALMRAQAAGLVDARRLAVLRAGSNFDRPHPGQTAFQSIRADSGGFDIARHNLVHAGRPLIDDIVTRWSLWKDGVPVR
jgi:purine nucleoside permease